MSYNYASNCSFVLMRLSCFMVFPASLTTKIKSSSPCLKIIFFLPLNTYICSIRFFAFFISLKFLRSTLNSSLDVYRIAFLPLAENKPCVYCQNSSGCPKLSILTLSEFSEDCWSRLPSRDESSKKIGRFSLYSLCSSHALTKLSLTK